MSNMVNFRMKQSELDAIDSVARRLGQNRSDFIRAAIKESIAKHGTETPVEISNAPGCKGSSGNPRSCEVKQLAKLATGIKICTVCGIKTA